MKLTIYVALFISALTIGRAQEVTLKANAGIQGLNTPVSTEVGMLSLELD